MSDVYYDDRLAPTASGMKTLFRPAYWWRGSGANARYVPTHISDQFSEYELYDEPDWDGYGAEPIAADTVAAARSFYRLLPSDPRADIAPGADGTIGFEWRFGTPSHRRYILIDIGPGELVTAREILEDGRIKKHRPTTVNTSQRFPADMTDTWPNGVKKLTAEQHAIADAIVQAWLSRRKAETREAASQPRPKDAGAPEIEVSSAMVNAGVDEFLAHYPDTGTGDVLDRQMVTAIYRKMRCAESGLQVF